MKYTDRLSRVPFKPRLSPRLSDNKSHVSRLTASACLLNKHLLCRALTLFVTIVAPLSSPFARVVYFSETKANPGLFCFENYFVTTNQCPRQRIAGDAFHERQRRGA